ncbi:MAG: penicillin-binding protein [Frankiaceae bacterium]|jgi:peptidoglycan glycosyltransferase|nr:penicillin-binding protein [Frankiaceae bacterium]
MNRSIRRVAIAALVMFGALLVNANVVQVGRAESLKDNPHNGRVLLSEYSHQRGPIVVDGHAIALSSKTHDAFKYLRTYPGGAVYAPVTGYYSLLYGATGIEQAENDILSGDSDKLFVRRLSDYFTGREPQGGQVVLTLNARAQQTAYDALAGKRGAVVALDPSNGRVLALVSRPSYDPTPLTTHNSRTIRSAYRALLHQGDDPLINRATSQIYPPGSTFKVITAAAALSSGKYTPSSQLPAPDQLTLPQTTHKLQNFEGEQCAGGGQISLADALRVSCNTAFGGLGLRLGADAIKKQAEAFGFGKALSIPIPVAASVFPGDIPPPQVAFSAIGQYSDAVTPLQMAMVAAGVANHGVVMQPYLVAKTLAPDLSTLSQTVPHELGRAVDPGVAADLTRMMQGVVESGTGTAAQLPGIAVAGKTGTAENVPGQPTHAWFICFAPAQNPKVAVAVLVEHGGTGGTAAAPIARQVMQAVLGP